MEWVVIKCIAYVEVISMLMKFSKPRIDKAQKIEASIFVGFGAGIEDELFRVYAENEGKVLRLDQQDISSFNLGHTIKILTLLETVRSSVTRLERFWPALPLELREYRIEFLTHLAMRVARYSFFLVWFDSYTRELGKKPAVCLVSPDTLAFAAVDAQVISEFFQHGLIRLSGVFPDFTRIRALTEYEARYLQCAIPQAVVRTASYSSLPVANTRDGCILVASIYGSSALMNLIIPFLEWAESIAATVLVRLHPKEQGYFWLSLQPRFRFSIECRDETIVGAFERIRPAIVVSWFSTALVDALNHELVPVMLADNDEDSVRDLVYPLVKRTLNWPSDKAEIEKALTSPTSRAALVETLKACGR